MAKKQEANGNGLFKNWKSHLSLLFGAVLLVAVCVAIRAYWGPGPVQAQAPISTARAASAAAAPKQASNPNAPPSVMAVVNGHQITRQDLARECLRRYGEEILESIVNQHLILQACRDKQIQITQQDVEDEITRIASKFGLSVDRWLQMLDSERNIPASKYRAEIVWPMLALRRLAASEIVVTQQELNEAYESEYGPQVEARMIVLSQLDAAQDWQKYLAAHPSTFAEQAKKVSEDTSSASVGGIIPPIRRHVGDPEVEKVAFALREGEVSPVIQVGNQYIILKCERHLPATKVDPKNQLAISNQLTQRIEDHKLREASGKIFAELQQRADIVNVYNDAAKQQQYPGVAALVNGKQITIQQLSEECISRHGMEILDGEINRSLLVQALQQANIAVTDQDIDAEIARAAESYGYINKDQTPNTEAWLAAVTEPEGLTVDLYVRDAVWPTVALKNLVKSGVVVDQTDMQKGFESNYGERVQVLAIVLSNHRQAQKVWEMARNNPTDHFFGELAHEYSVEPASRANNGRVPPIRRYSGQPNVEEAAFKLKPGQLSQIIAVADQFIILRCLGRTEPVVSPEEFDDVKGELQRDLYEKKLRIAMAKKFEQLREAAQIDNFLAGTTQSRSQVRQASATAPVAR